MPTPFFKPTDRRTPTLRRADLVETEAPGEETYGHHEETPEAIQPQRIEYAAIPATRHVHHEDDFHRTEDASDAVVDEVRTEPDDEMIARQRRRIPIWPLAALLLIGGATYVYLTDLGGIADGVRTMKAQLLGTASTTPAERTVDNTPAVQQMVATTREPTQTAALPPPPAAEPMRVRPVQATATQSTPATTQQASDENMAAVMQQQQMDRMRQLLASTATLSRDTANQANRQETRIADLEQRLIELSKQVSTMNTAASQPPIPVAATPETEKVVEGYSLTGASQTSARVSTGGKEEDVKIGVAHPFLGNVIGLKQYANKADWRCNYELVTDKGVIRPATTLCKKG